MQIVPSWANQVLPQLLMNKSSTSLTQCRYILNISMKKFCAKNKRFFYKMTAIRELRQFFDISFEKELSV